jgi:hypothetical protein
MTNFRIGICFVLAVVHVPYSAHAATSPSLEVNDLVVWSVNEYTNTDAAVALAARVPSQLLIRGWFKWANANDFAREAHVVPKAHANGQLFGAGVTMSALYRGENGLDEATFLDYATRDPNGRLYPARLHRACEFGRAAGRGD